MNFYDRNGLPIDINLTPLLGRKLTTVHIGKFWLNYLSQEPEKTDISISMEGGIIFTDVSGAKTEIDDRALNGGLLCKLIGATIENASRRESDGGLCLKMSDGIHLMY